MSLHASGQSPARTRADGVDAPSDYAVCRVHAMLPIRAVRSHGENDARPTIAREPAGSAGPSPGVSVSVPVGSAIAHAALRRRTLAFLCLFVVPSVAQSILLTVVPL